MPKKFVWLLLTLWCAYFKGQVIGIMGPVGSGKSTILQGILGETLHRAIDDIFAQKPIEFCRNAIANGIGYVGQESKFMSSLIFFDSCLPMIFNIFYCKSIN